MATINELLENEEFSEKMSTTETTEEVIKVFADYGVAVTEEELDAAVAYAKENGGELSEDELNNVAGGVVAECVALGGLLITLGEKLGVWDWWKKKLKIK